ncbi:helix-turn-helix transcriptional regulator [Pseudomonas typographi]|uniref:Helix-turn-helix transcriptional regulator n=1 Tax=Pseudomonas typographi TaxID=2715964 RepID=A0ABR7Z1G3_9PSED|nr:AraC family transcriptional regulator [Pseudomonas typographi]MBD1551659.1 helix-turn-helix transcriptional regulator [Pseudomonas typographi]MBD1587087.1 helix-turn-helix transcriptional regulator [Pseudomonas typographi]MBD1599323.1 helix-turn-helix transcriptional regulator [Pseudomonas typographi]
MASTARVPTYGMRQRSDRTDFHIREKSLGNAEGGAHRHEYFQIQVNLGAPTTQRIGNVERPFAAQALAFILPHRIHYIPPMGQGHCLLINFDQHLLLPHLDCSPLDLEDVPLARAPELAPFRFQQHLDFVLGDADWADALALLARMRGLDQDREFGTREYLKGCLLQLIALVCRAYAQPLKALAATNATTLSRRDALARMTDYVRKHLADPALDLKTVAAATYLSPNYLTHWLRKETGKTFSELVLERRMHLARSLLLGSERSIGDIAGLCGFADEAYFSRRFRQAHGMAPSQFRRGQQGDG